MRAQTRTARPQASVPAYAADHRANSPDVISRCWFRPQPPARHQASTLVGSGCSYAARTIASGVIQRRALDGGRGSFHALAVVRADDRFHGFLGRFACDRFGDRAITRPPAAALLECHEPSNGGLLLLCQDAVARDREPVLVPPPNAQRRADDRSVCKQQPAATGPGVALQHRGSSGPVNESIRAGLGRPLLDHGPEQSRDVASPHCCFDEPARGPSACSRPGGGRLSKRITLLWSRSLRLAKHQRGSGSPASMASDSWIAASMQQSDAEIDTIAARPEHQ